MSSSVAPACSALQREASLKYKGPKPPKRCVVTGGTGFVGLRLVEMLIERGAEKVISFDIVPPPEDAWIDPRIEYRTGDITDTKAVEELCEGADCVWHMAAIVGPFHPNHLYKRVNYEGTVNLINACKKHKVPKIVMSSSPSTRFTTDDIDGLSVAEMPEIPMKSYVQIYAETKALGERAMRDACCDELMTVAVAPHQVYGPRDNLFLPNLLEAGGTGKLRVFARSRTGYGMNRVCFTHVDNYCHGLIMAEKALYKGSKALGRFYIITDADTHPHPEGYAYFWKEIDKAVVGMGFSSLWDKFKLPYWLLIVVAYICNVVAWVLNIKLKLNPFSVRVLTMHRWFRVDDAEEDLKVKPIIRFNEGWAETIEWFRVHWLPKFKANSGIVGLSSQTQAKIDVQEKSTKKMQ